MPIQKSKELFVIKTKKKANCCGMSTGMTFPAGVNGSVYNTAHSQVKVSNLVHFLDQILVDKSIVVWANETAKILVIEQGKFVVLTDGNEVRGTAGYTHDHAMIADMLWEIQCTRNTEMQDLFKKFQTAKLPLGQGDVAKFCDSYYWHNVKASYQLNEGSTLTEAEIQSAVRSKYLVKAPIMGSLEVPESRFDEIEAIKEVRYTEKNDPEGEDAYVRICASGEFRIKYNFDGDVARLIPDLSFLDGMVGNETFRKFVTKLNFRTQRVLGRMTKPYTGFDDVRRIEDLGRDSVNVSLVGKPGTGKSHVVHAAAAALGLPIAVVNNSHNTDEDRYEGMTKIVDGKPQSITTEAVNIFKHGGILLLEEVNLAQAAVIMGALGQAVEYPYILKQDGYKDILRHPLCIVVCTMNVGTAGTKTVAQQFANRFRTSYVMNDPGRDEFIARLMSATEETEDLCEWVYDCYAAVTESIREDNAQADVDGILNALSVRTCIGAIENMQEGSSPKEAIYDSIIGKIAEQDAEVAANCRQVVSAMIDYRTTRRR